MSLQELRRLDAGRPHDQLGRQHVAAREAHAVGAAPRRPCALVCTCTPSLRSSSRSPPCDRRSRQRRQDAVGRLDHDEPDVLVGIDAVEPVGHHLTRRAVQLRGQLDAGRAGADDRDVQLLGPQRRRLRVGADAGMLTMRAMEALRVGLRILQRDRVLARRPACRSRWSGCRPRSPACRRRTRAPRRDHRRPRRRRRRDLHLAPLAVEPDHLADPVAEVVPVRLREVVDLVRRSRSMLPAAISCSCGFQTCVRCLVDQRDVRPAALAELVAEPRGELEPAGAAADDDDAVQRVGGSVAGASAHPAMRTSAHLPTGMCVSTASSTSSGSSASASVSLLSTRCHPLRRRARRSTCRPRPSRRRCRSGWSARAPRT